LLNLKYEVYDENELRTKMDVVHQEPKQKVQLYYDKLERFFCQGPHLRCKEAKMVSGQITTKLKELLVVCIHQDMDEFLSSVIEVVKVLGEIGETPYLYRRRGKRN
jgi:hypothetical protein